MNALIELNTLRVFEAVARNKSFSKAAEELFLSQSAVSQQIKALEEHLEVKLFYRSAKEITLTEAGEKILVHVQNLLQSTYQLKELVSESQQSDPLRLSVGLSSVAAPLVLEALLKTMRVQFPGTHLELRVASTQEIVKRLLKLGLDFAFVAGPIKVALLEREVLCQDSLVFVCSPEHPWSGRSQIGLKELLGEVFLWREKGDGMRAVIDVQLAKHRIALKKTLEIQDNAVLKTAVIKNLGVSILPRHFVVHELKQGLLCALPVQGITFRWEVSLVYHQDKVFRVLEREVIRSIAQDCSLFEEIKG